MFLKFSQILQENTCARVSFLIKLQVLQLYHLKIQVRLASMYSQLASQNGYKVESLMANCSTVIDPQLWSSCLSWKFYSFFEASLEKCDIISINLIKKVLFPFGCWLIQLFIYSAEVKALAQCWIILWHFFTVSKNFINTVKVSRENPQPFLRY